MSVYSKFILLLLMTGLCFNFPEDIFAADLSLSQGFCDIPWETQADNLSDLKQIAGTPDVSYYTRTENPYEIYGEDLGRVIYGFYNGRLFSALLDIAGKEKFDSTLNGLIGEFGSPNIQYRVGHDVYIWEVERVEITLKYYDIQKIHKLAFYYTPLAQMLGEKQTTSAEETILKLQ